MTVPVIDLESCVKCEICVEIAPDVFQINDMGFVEVIATDNNISPEVHEAIKNCPKDCISIE